MTIQPIAQTYGNRWLPKSPLYEKDLVIAGVMPQYVAEVDPPLLHFPIEEVNLLCFHSTLAAYFELHANKFKTGFRRGGITPTLMDLASEESVTFDDFRSIQFRDEDIKTAHVRRHDRIQQGLTNRTQWQQVSSRPIYWLDAPTQYRRTANGHLMQRELADLLYPSADNAWKSLLGSFQNQVMEYGYTREGHHVLIHDGPLPGTIENGIESFLDSLVGP